MAFKASVAPFHFWTPDVYDGAPTVFTSFMATIVKAAVFVAFHSIRQNLMRNTQLISLEVMIYRNATQSGVTPLAYHFEKPMVVTKTIQ